MTTKINPTRICHAKDGFFNTGDKMSDEERKIMELFNCVHGEITGSCYTEFEYDEDDPLEVSAVVVMKDGNLCWRATKHTLIYSYITKDF